MEQAKFVIFLSFIALQINLTYQQQQQVSCSNKNIKREKSQVLTIQSNFLNFNDSFKHPRLDEEVNKIVARESARLKLETLPETVLEDGKYILNELNEELLSCMDEFKNIQLRKEFHACTHARVNDYRDKVWEFHNTLKSYQLEFSSSSSLVVPYALILLTSATVVSYGMLPHFKS